MESPKSAEEEHATNNLSELVENVEKIAEDIGLPRWRVGMMMALRRLGAFSVLGVLARWRVGMIMAWIMGVVMSDEALHLCPTHQGASGQEREVSS